MDLKLLANLIANAKIIYPDNKIMQQVCVTQAIHESNFQGKQGGSKLALVYNNLFGIKAAGTHRPEKYATLYTTEVIRGRERKVIAKFAWNATQLDSFKQYSRVLALKRYAPVRLSESVPEAFNNLVKGGYATDPKYSIRLRGIWIQYVKPVFDKE